MNALRRYNYQRMIDGVLNKASEFLINNNQGPSYTVEKKIENFEIRKYNPSIVAQTVVKGTHQDSGNQAFHILAGYIFGKNDQNAKIEMTAPVTLQQIGQNEYQIQFFMPKQWTLQTLPKPNDSRIAIKEIPERKMFVQRYIGNWSDKLYNTELVKAKTALQTQKLRAKRQPIWARYNSPLAPSFLRTNDIMFQI